MIKFNVLTVILLFFSCGSVFGATTRVIGGDQGDINSGKYHVSFQNLTGDHVCGGAVITYTSILTAAHCVYGAAPQYIKAVVGTTDLSKTVKVYNVSQIHVHDNFNFTTRTNDIAILKVDGLFRDEDVDLIKLDTFDVKEGDLVTLSSFGATQLNGGSILQLHTLNLKAFSQKTCKYAMRYNRDVCDSMFCTFNKIGQGTCHGDSGSPLVKEGRLVGVVSWGIPCAVGFPDVHTRINHFLEWIQEIIISDKI